MIAEKFRGQYWFLSNMSDAQVTYDGVTYPTVENAYQAAKTLDLEARKPFETYNCWDAKKYSHKLQLRPDWNAVKDGIMYGLLEQKFAIPALKVKLEATGNEGIVHVNEHGDTYWGVCKGVGTNKLGVMLMKIRDGQKGQVMERSIAIVGTRKPSTEMFRWHREVAEFYASSGVCIVTGGAYGIDQAAMEGAVLAAKRTGKPLKDLLTVFLPWASYNADIVPSEARVIVGGWDDEDRRLARLHPTFATLTQGAQKMMLRNAQIVRLGRGMLAYPSYKNNVPAGGTAHDILCAVDLGKTWFNTTNEECRHKIQGIMNQSDFKSSEPAPVKHLGTLITCQMGKLTSYKADVYLNIARKSIEHPHVRHRPVLAPSAELFSWYMANKNSMSKADCFAEYKRMWLLEKAHDKAYRDQIDKICDALDQGATIAMACFCAEPTYCHRSLVAHAIKNVMIERGSIYIGENR